MEIAGSCNRGVRVIKNKYTISLYIHLPIAHTMVKTIFGITFTDSFPHVLLRHAYTMVKTILGVMFTDSFPHGKQ